MKIVVPTLSRDGYISNTEDTMRKIFEYYLVSEYSQSNTFRGEVVSITYDLEMGANVGDKRDNINRSLSKLFTRYFDNPDISVNIDTKHDPKLNITIKISVIINNRTYILSNNISSTKNIINSIDDAVASIHIS